MIVSAPARRRVDGAGDLMSGEKGTLGQRLSIGASKIAIQGADRRGLFIASGRLQTKGMAATTHLHIVHPPCPKCLSSRTIRTEKGNSTDTLYCPDCGHIWQVNVPRS